MRSITELSKKSWTSGHSSRFSRGRTALCISELDNRHVKDVRDVVSEGDEMDVKVIGIDQQGRIKLSRKALLNR